MSDYRLPIHIEHGEDRTYVVDTYGRRYEIQSYEMREKEYPLHYADEFRFFKIPRKWDMYLGLVEVPDEAESLSADPEREDR